MIPFHTTPVYNSFATPPTTVWFCIFWSLYFNNRELNAHFQRTPVFPFSMPPALGQSGERVSHYDSLCEQG